MAWWWVPVAIVATGIVTYRLTILAIRCRWIDLD